MTARSSHGDEELWFKVQAEIPARAEDALLALLGDYADQGAEVLGDDARTVYPQLSDMPTGWVRVGIYARQADLTGLKSAFEEALADLLDKKAIPPSAHLLPPEFIEPGWLDRWKAFFHVTRVSSRLTVRPTWEDHIPAPGERVIDLDPGNAFGTGGHETTRLCLQALDHELPVRSMLDVGTGSGILSIAAAKLGVRHVVAVDNDAAAVLVARENSARNCVDDLVSISGRPVESIEERFDIVVANIVSDVLIPLAPSIAARVDVSGVLILSGILADEADKVLCVYENLDLKEEKRSQMEEWIVLTLRRMEP